MLERLSRKNADTMNTTKAVSLTTVRLDATVASWSGLTFAVSGPASGAGAGPLDRQVSYGVNHCGDVIDSAQTQVEVAGFDG